MNAALVRVILYVQDVDRLASFYREALGLPVVEEIAGEWAVLKAGACELALHRVGEAYRLGDKASWRAESNAKLVLAVDQPLDTLRAALLSAGVAMGEIKSYPGTGPLCDGRDPEGNVSQLAQDSG